MKENNVVGNRKAWLLQSSTMTINSGTNQAAIMSVMTSAVIGHQWTGFSEGVIQRISWAATGGRVAPKWFGDPDFKSAEEDFHTHGCVSFFLPQRYSLLFSRNILELTLAIRWSGFLIYKGERKQFLSGCEAVAKLANADEFLLLPEGTVMEDFIRTGVDYGEFKRATEDQLGPPDLDIQKFYREHEIRDLGQKRIHYFRARVTDP